jgi:hypothetical protein
MADAGKDCMRWKNPIFSRPDANDRLWVKCAYLTAALLFVLMAGCSSPDVNPRAPRNGTGYVDFYTDVPEELSWDVKCARDQTGEMKQIFSQFEPVAGNILRLAVSPGDHRFQVWFINEVTTGPQTVVVHVESTKVTPVHITLTKAGSASIDNKSYEYRATAHATRRVTRISTAEQQVFQIGAAAATPLDYQPKERMPYFSASK